MSMSQANAALLIDVAAETSRLGVTLTQAEQMVNQSAQRMGRQVDGSMSKMGDQISRTMSRALGAGLAIKVVDEALKKVADGIREGQGAKQIGEAIAGSIVTSIENIPIAGALMKITSTLGDRLLGGSMETEQGRLIAAQMQKAQAEAAAQAPAALRSLGLMGAEGAEKDRLEREQYLERVEKLVAAAKVGRVQMVDGVEQELDAGALSEIAEMRARALREFDVKVAERIRKEEEARQDLYDRHQKKLAQEAEKAAQENERRIREHQKEMTRNAIAALEAQLEVAQEAIAPSRSERLAKIMQSMGTGITTADTALGAFSFAMGDPAQISRDILDNATRQLEALERIEEIQQQIRDLQKGTGLN